MLAAEPFMRSDTARTMDSSTGLGLSIARAVVEAHGGTLTLANRQPRGLTATITLPCGKASGDPPEPDPNRVDTPA
jgi:signal transduction histidine kinase